MENKSIKTLPRLKFAHLPTAVEALPHLSAELGGPRLLVKRDDQTGLAFGGNKTRKLEFLLAEAQANGARTLITAGALQSNHCRQTAAAAARYGFACTLVLSLPPGQSETQMEEQGGSGNLLLDRLLGARIIWTSRELRNQVLEETFQDAWEAGQRPYLIPYGGSNPTGAVAYAFAMEELLLQGVKPDWIVFASSSGGTQSGLVLGAQMFNYRGKVLGISVDEPMNVLRERVAKLASETADLLGGDLEFKAEDILVNADYLGGGYGVMGEPEKEAITQFAHKEGLLLDPVYTGRAAAGLLDLIRRGFFERDETVLFWHTGGAPALFADGYQGMI
jgi:D-cysteine desulfhydrase family pyridoxal phosphate-dependent enzyme